MAMNHNATCHRTKNCTNSLAPSVGTKLFVSHKKKVMVTTRRTNPGQDNIHEKARRPNPGQDNPHEEVEFAGLEARIAQLNQQLAQA
jgi:hypothetical protein